MNNNELQMLFKQNVQTCNAHLCENIIRKIKRQNTMRKTTYVATPIILLLLLLQFTPHPTKKICKDYAIAKEALTILFSEETPHNLSQKQTPSGDFGSITSHPYAFFALATKSTTITEPLLLAIECSEETQNYNGSWGDGSLQLTLLNTAALMRAKELGWNDNTGTLHRAITWLRTHTTFELTHSSITKHAISILPNKRG